MSLSLTALASVAGGLAHAPLAILSLIPLLAVGINYYRYQSIDPESKPIDAQTVGWKENLFKYKKN